MKKSLRSYTDHTTTEKSHVLIHFNLNRLKSIYNYIQINKNIIHMLKKHMQQNVALFAPCQPTRTQEKCVPEKSKRRSLTLITWAQVFLDKSMLFVWLKSTVSSGEEDGKAVGPCSFLKQSCMSCWESPTKGKYSSMVTLDSIL